MSGAQDWQTTQAEQAPPMQGTGAPPSFPVTIGLIAINALVFAIMVSRGVSVIRPTPQQALAFGADFGPLTLNGERRSEEHTSELQSRENPVCRLRLDRKNE